MSIESYKSAFIAGTADVFKACMPLVPNIKGVGIVPLHVYSAGRPELIGKPCVVLGKERAGCYTDKLNYFGGKVTDKAGSRTADAATVAGILFEEVYEEMGIFLTAQLFKHCLVEVLPVGGVSLLFICHITGISRGWWQSIMDDRRARNPALAWKFQEMSEIEHVPLGVCNSGGVSDYVRGSYQKLAPLVGKLTKRNYAMIGQFPTTKGMKL